MTDNILKSALIISMDNELEMLPSDLTDYHRFSSKFEEEMKALIRKSNIKYIKINKYKIRKSIVTAASLVIIFTALSFSVQAIRLPIIKLKEKIHTEFSEIMFDNEENIKVPDTIEKIYIPSYIPKGYSLQDENSMRTMHFLYYTNDENQEISIEQFTLNVGMAVDTEGITTEEITINSMKGIIYSKRGLTTIIVNDDSYVHLISGYESREELIKVAESLYVKK